MMQLSKRMAAFFLCLALFTGGFSGTAAAAPEWPSNVSIQAESGIVMDAETGTVLWGQNIHNQYFPASITKIMTALIVIESCSLDETVTFSHNAVFNVESGSSNAGINEGDQLSVKDCLYALLLKSANEAANALAEHVSGSTEQFAELMNQKARELGCIDTHFANPSGLNNPEHYTSAYDMALIARAAFSNPVFEEIDSTTYYKLPPNSINPEGLTIYPGHKMLKKSTPFYYPGIIGGKTGYTTLAGNTLVTCAEKNDMKLIAVILKGTTPQYWTDTKRLLDFGFENFVSVKAAEHETTYTSVISDLSFGGLSIDKPEALILDPNCRITLPKTADFADADAMLSYDISADDPPNTIAKIYYSYNDRQIGCTYLEINEKLFGTPAADSEAAQAALKGSENESVEGSDAAESAANGNQSEEILAESQRAAETEDYREKALRPFEIPTIAWIILIAVAVVIAAACGVALFLYKRDQSEHDSLLRRERRMQRLQESGISVEEFNALIEQRRSASSSKKKRGRGNRHLKFK